MSRIPNLTNIETPKHNNFKVINIKEYQIPEIETIVLKDEQSIFKFINKVKSIVRTSIEYQDYVYFLKEYVDMRYCSILNNVKNYDYMNKKYNSKIKIEIHHEPFTLHDIIHTIIRKHQAEGIEINELTVAEECMYLHYKNMVGLTPLSITVHELVHNNKLFIPLDSLYGDYMKFYRKYKTYMTPELIEKIQYKMEKTRQIKEADFDILKTKFIYYNIEGMSIPSILNYDTDFDEFIKKNNMYNIKI